jgi:hypothetical protein
MPYPPPGQIITAERFSDCFSGVYTVSVGTDTLLIRNIPAASVVDFSLLADGLLLGISPSYNGKTVCAFIEWVYSILMEQNSSVKTLILI